MMTTSAQNLLRWLAALFVTAIVTYVIYLYAHDVGLQSIAFTFWLNWLLMFWAYVIYRTDTLKLPEAYFHIRPFELRWVRIVGVKFYQRIIRKVSVFNPELNLKAGRAGLQQLVQATKNAEESHAFIFIIVMGFTIYALVQQWWLAAFWYFFFNLLINGYPVLVQRYNRNRIMRILKRGKDELSAI